MWEWLRRVARKHTTRGGAMTRHADLLPRYKRLREVGLELNTRLVKTLPKSVLDEGGKKLGILRKNVLVLDTEDEIALLMDFCLHDVRRQGANAVDRYLEATPPPPGSDDMVLLQALRLARFSLIVVEALEPGVGARVKDILRDEPFFLVDVGMSRSVPVGMILATRVMEAEGIGMTTGAALPVAVLSPAELGQYLEGLKSVFRGTDFHHLSHEDASEFSATVIRGCLKQGAAERIAYIDPGQERLPGPGPRAVPQARGVGRNDFCPCGSGKKFKRCCGAPK